MLIAIDLFYNTVSSSLLRDHAVLLMHYGLKLEIAIHFLERNLSITDERLDHEVAAILRL